MTLANGLPVDSSKKNCDRIATVSRPRSHLSVYVCEKERFREGERARERERERKIKRKKKKM